MMQLIRSIPRHWHIGATMLAGGFFLAGMAMDEPGWMLAPVAAAAITLIIYGLLFHKQATLLSLMLVVPLSIPLPGSKSLVFNFPSELITGLLAFAFAIYFLVKERMSTAILRHPLSLLLLAETGWMAISTFASEMPGVSLKRLVVRICYIVVFYYLFTGVFRNKKNIPLLFLLYMTGMIYPIIHAMIRHSRLNFDTFTSYLMPMPFFYDHTIYGACLAFLVPALLVFLLSRKTFGWPAFGYYAGWAVFILATTALFFSYSRAAWISLGAALIFFLLLRLRVRLWMLMALLLAGGTIGYHYRFDIRKRLEKNEAVSNKDATSQLISVTNIQTDASNMERLNRWSCALRMAADKPVTGFGPGTYQFFYGAYQSRTEMTRISTFSGNKGHAHSEYLLALSEHGWPGMLLFTAIVLVTLQLGMRLYYRADSSSSRLLALACLLALITYFVHGIFNAFLDFDKAAILVFGAMAALVSIDLYHQPRSRK